MPVYIDTKLCKSWGPNEIYPVYYY